MSQPCLSCGACCAHFRVSFYWAESDAHPAGTVPHALTVPITPHLVAMRGTDTRRPRCVALSGEVGSAVSCTIYPQRASPCREFSAGTDACNRAREKHGLAPLVLS